MAGCELPGLCPPSCRGQNAPLPRQSEMKWPCQPCVQRPRARSWEPPARPKLRKSWPGWGVRRNSFEDVWTPHRGAHASLPMGRSWAPHGNEEREPKGRRGKEHKKRTAAPDFHPDGDGAEGRLLGRCAQSCSSDAGHPRYGQKLSDPLHHKGKTELEAVGTEVAADQDPRAPTYVGLINQGLTCYLNALLQCLFLTPEFLDKIQESPKSSELEQALNQIFCRLAEQRGAVPTQALTACLNLGYGQRDVGDVFLYLLQSLGREDLQEVFQSEVEKVIRCSVCDVEDYIPSGGRMLLLPLASHAQLCGLGEEQVPQEPTQESAGLSQDMDALSFPQIQNFDDEDNLLFCENCNRKTPALEKKRFLRLPKILILQVRELTFENGKFHKIQGPISVSEVLTLQIGPKKADASHSTDSCRARPSPALEQKRYHLYAMCNHSGDCTGGHYTALIRPRGQQHWYRFNDRHVQWVGTLPGPNALRPEVPYLLMYRCEDSEDRQEEEPKDEVPEQRAWDTAVPQRRGPPAEGQGRAPKRHTAAALPEDSTLASPLLEHSEEWTGAGGSGAQTKRRPWVEASQSLDKAGENAGHQDPEGLKKTLERELATEPEGDSVDLFSSYGLPGMAVIPFTHGMSSYSHSLGLRPSMDPF